VAEDLPEHNLLRLDAEDIASPLLLIAMLTD
jgi:hypothetical protein